MERTQRETWELSRRTFLYGVAGAAAVSVLPDLGRPAAAAGTGGPDQVWLGADYWANRVQDWMVSGGQIRCVADSANRICRTAAVLTTALEGPQYTVSARTGTLVAGTGFSGFLLGIGEPGTDYRRAASVLGASGGSGGVLAVYGNDGVARFRNHTTESNPLGFPELSGSTRSGSGPVRTTSENVLLTLTSQTSGSGNVTLTLRVTDAGSGALLSQVARTFAAAEVVGGLSLVSSGAGTNRATYWFADVAATGPDAVAHPERALGPVVGTIFSVANDTLKLTAQLAPIAADASTIVSLETRPAGESAWTVSATSDVGAGYAAILRVDGWDATLAHDYRVTVSIGGDPYLGTVPAEPAADGPLTVAAVTCTKASHRPFDAASGNGGAPKLPGEQYLYLFASTNAYFPHEQLTASIAAQEPDVFVTLGDQFYETSPTHEDMSSAPELDLLYRWMQWHWAFQRLTRDRPTYVLIDDHDVFQGNIFGEGGVALKAGASYDSGGYEKDPAWVNVVQRIQCGHNPDPYDPTPVAQGITVYFTTFDYGGARFVLLEDRKFKSPATGLDPNGVKIPTAQLQLLGTRQEQMLASVASSAGGPPVLVFTQSMYASLETNTAGKITANKGSNGWPTPARDRALASIKAAGGVIVSGDTHLPALIRHGMTTYTDGPVQMSVPAGSTSVQRWFQPTATFPNGTGQPYTGDTTDGFGHRMRVLAVRNMAFTQSQVLSAYGHPGYGHRDLKQEGYGLVRVDRAARTYTLEAWRFDSQPDGGDVPMPGWPVVVPFDQA